ncbi:Uma2 family endonuclease [candidate division KSB1 bacterium]|nr:Uma2 family endonuclease [candidate division KSB1 bacterium]
MEQLAARKYYSVEEYLALEETAEFKSEFYQGEMFAMAGGTIDHNLIIGNIHANLYQTLRNRPCFVFLNDVRLWVEEKDLFTYPDIMIICGKLEFYPGRNDTITNPLVIFEVLSDTTKNYDRGEKFVFYRTIPTFKEYVLIEQSRMHVEHFYIGEPGNWILSEYNQPEAFLKLQQIDFQISLAEIYQRVGAEA